MLFRTIIESVLPIQRLRSYIPIIAGFYAAVAVAAALLTYFDLVQERTKTSFTSLHTDLRADVEELRTRLLEREEIYDTAVRAVNELNPDRLDTVSKLIHSLESLSTNDTQALVSKVSALEQTTSHLSDELEGIRSALNPTQPEELLRVIRLGDKFEFVEQKLAALDDKIENSEKDGEKSIQETAERLDSRMDGLIDVLMWIGLLIIPGTFYVVRELFLTTRPAASQPRHDKRSATKDKNEKDKGENIIHN